MRHTRTKEEVENALIETVLSTESTGVTDEQAKLFEVRIKDLMWVMNIPPDWFADVLKGGIECDKCQRLFLACLAQVGLEGAVLCEECKIEEDPLIAMHEMSIQTEPFVDVCDGDVRSRGVHSDWERKS